MPTEARKRARIKYSHSDKGKATSKRYRESHKEQCLTWTLDWQKRNHKHILELLRKRNSTQRGKALKKAIDKRYYEKNRIKRFAKAIVHNALRAGKIKKLNCEKCNELITEGHHPDYTKPLYVIWLCKKCHTKLHKKSGYPSGLR